MSRNILITLLGRPAKRDGAYKTARYRFPDGSFSEPTMLLGRELVKRISPDAVILLGTPGSLWAWLQADSHGTDDPSFSSEEIGQLLQLNEAVEQQQVTQKLLDDSTSTLRRVWGCEVCPLLVSNCETTAEQHDLLIRLAPLIQQGDNLILDLTHGFRHVSLLLMMAAVYLRSIRSATIRFMYTSFYDPENKVGTVFDLAGLNAMLDWQDALSAFRKDGDAGVFAPLLEADHASSKAVSNLREASYSSRIFRHEKAWTAERAVANDLEKNCPAGISGLFAPELIRQLGQRTGSQRAVRLAELARRQLRLGSYDRAVLLGLAAAQESHARDDESSDDRHARLLNEKPDYILLNAIRNSIAHTSSKAQQHEAEKAMRDKTRLEATLQLIFKNLF